MLFSFRMICYLRLEHTEKNMMLAVISTAIFLLEAFTTSPSITVEAVSDYSYLVSDKFHVPPPPYRVATLADVQRSDFAIPGAVRTFFNTFQLDSCCLRAAASDVELSVDLFTFYQPATPGNLISGNCLESLKPDSGGGGGSPQCSYNAFQGPSVVAYSSAATVISAAAISNVVGLRPDQTNYHTARLESDLFWHVYVRGGESQGSQGGTSSIPLSSLSALVYGIQVPTSTTEADFKSQVCQQVQCSLRQLNIVNVTTTDQGAFLKTMVFTFAERSLTPFYALLTDKPPENWYGPVQIVSSVKPVAKPQYSITIFTGLLPDSISTLTNEYLQRTVFTPIAALLSLNTTLVRVELFGVERRVTSGQVLLSIGITPQAQYDDATSSALNAMTSAVTTLWGSRAQICNMTELCSLTKLVAASSTDSSPSAFPVQVPWPASATSQPDSTFQMLSLIHI